MANLSAFDLSHVSEFNNDVLPPGEYHVRIAGDEIKLTKAGDQYLNLRYDVLDGPYARRILFDGLHFWHSSSEGARRMAQAKLKSIARACHLPNPDYVQDSSELLNREMLIRVKVKTDDYGDRNEIQIYKPVPAVPVGGSAPAPAPAPVPPAPAAAPMPPAAQPSLVPPSAPKPATPWDD